MAEGMAQTDAERILSFVQSKGRVDLYTATRALGLEAAPAEQAAGMLAQAGKLEIKYTPTGIHLIAKNNASIDAAPARGWSGVVESTGTPASEPNRAAGNNSEAATAGLGAATASLGAAGAAPQGTADKIVKREFSEEEVIGRARAVAEAIASMEKTSQIGTEELVNARSGIDQLRLEVECAARAAKFNCTDEGQAHRLKLLGQQLNKLKAREVVLTLRLREGRGKTRGRMGIGGRLVAWFRGLFRRRKAPAAGPVRV